MIIGGAIFGILNYFYQPVWKSWNNYNTINGFYEEPENTIETIFLGASITVNGITPTELYRDYGICAYNLGTEQQPVMASYYWMLEAERLHADSLKTVVIDASMFRRTPEDAFYQKALDGMKFSTVKIQAAIDYSDSVNDAWNYLFPALEYHTRWKSVDLTDFEKKNYKAELGLRGYNFDIGRVIDSYPVDIIGISEYDVDKNIEAAVFDRESLYYLNKMINFCKERHLKLVLMKTPAVNTWGMAYHNAVVDIAEKYNLDFIDFNYEPYIDEIQYNEAVDNKDVTHLNYYGARKVTGWFGDYLLTECDNIDVRGEEKYAFMRNELEEYETRISDKMDLLESTDITEYLDKALSEDNNIVFITVKDEASTALTKRQRKYIKESGLKQLSKIDHWDSYIGIIDSKGVIYEAIDRMEDYPELHGDEKVTAEKLEDKNAMENLNLRKIKEDKKQELEKTEVTFSYDLDKKTTVKLVSGGWLLGNVSSCKIDGTEYSKNERGMNVVVYNREKREVVDSRTFDTYANATELSWDLEAELETAEKEGVSYDEMPEMLQKLYLYNEMCEERKEKIK